MSLRMRNYELDESRLLLQREPCFHHPLLPRAAPRQEDGPAKACATAGPVEAGLPLDLNAEVDDPLRHGPAVAVPWEQRRERRPSDGRRWSGEEQERAAAAEWEGRKAAILQRFTASGSIAVTASLDVVTQPGRARLSAAQRLEQLEHPQRAGQEASRQVAVADVVARLRELNADLSSAWVAAERLTALRLAIKVARLLLDVSVPHFYPTLFVLVTDCLDTVGGLVWTRIVRKAEEGDTPTGPPKRLPAGFTWRDVPAAAQETCRNWFHKVGAIPELLPRLYLELALLRCYHFLEPAPPAATLARLSAMMRGLTHPLAAAYAHLYLVRRTAAVAPTEKAPLVSGLRDRLLQYRSVLAGHHDPALQRSALSRAAYLQLLDPPLEITIQALLKDAPPAQLPGLLASLACLAPSQGGPPVALPPAAVVLHLVAHLPGPFVAAQALPLTRLVAATSDASAKQAALFCALGRQLAEHPPPRDQQAAVLNDTWKVVARFSDLGDYLAVADVMLPFVLRHFGLPEVEVLLRDIARHLRGPPPPPAALASLEHLLDTLLAGPAPLPHLLALPQVGAVLAAFDGDRRLSASRCVLEAAINWPAPLTDPACLPPLLAAARALHDAVDPTVPPAARAAPARLLCRLIPKVAFRNDTERQLAFLGDCRAAFCNLDVQGPLVHTALRLAVTSQRAGAPRDLVRACLAFCAVTLSAVAAPLPRLHLALATAEVAGSAGALAHAEGALRAAIDALPEVARWGQDAATAAAAPPPCSTPDAALEAAVRKLANLVLRIPASLDSGPLALLHRLRAALETLSGFSPVATAAVLLPVLAALAQPRLPAPLPGLPAPAAAYCGEPAYAADLASLAASVTAAAITAAHAGEARARVGPPLGPVLRLVFQPGDDLARMCAQL
ncbi:hypothetical protein KFL_007790030 [Klebsormidium nitens]|uniref:Uncharacterized protein n=1 Tax=Klebsormidium nitens TaxID=105231 RepID=A0A1Y1IQ95_KLENI|nr:hypothetical protein KFL_007790030 [Klebsormidium nitens]|eukprot:GAQ91411.1 hypothetical protein KFL_007790030 [Klebsormidium nitens]